MIYTVGLDPTYMEIHNASMFEEWVDITRGRSEETGQAIRDDFGGQYVFTDLEHEAFLNVAAEDPLLVEIYRDDYAVIFKVKSGEAEASDG